MAASPTGDRKQLPQFGYTPCGQRHLAVNN